MVMAKRSSTLGIDANNSTIQSARVKGDYKEIAMTTASQNKALSGDKNILTLRSSVDCFVNVGDQNVTVATGEGTNRIKLWADDTVYLTTLPGETHIAARVASGTGTLGINEHA